MATIAIDLTHFPLPTVAPSTENDEAFRWFATECEFGATLQARFVEPGSGTSDIRWKLHIPRTASLFFGDTHETARAVVLRAYRTHREYGDTVQPALDRIVAVAWCQPTPAQAWLASEHVTRTLAQHHAEDASNA